MKKPCRTRKICLLIITLIGCIETIYTRGKQFVGHLKIRKATWMKEACYMALPCFLFENHLLLQLKVHQKKMMNHAVFLPHFCFQPKVLSRAYYKEKVRLVLAKL